MTWPCDGCTRRSVSEAGSRCRGPRSTAEVRSHRSTTFSSGTRWPTPAPRVRRWRPASSPRRLSSTARPSRSSVTCQAFAPGRCSFPSATPNPRPARTWLPCGPGPLRTGTNTSSRARNAGPPAAIGLTSSGCCAGQGASRAIPAASPCSSSTAAPPGSRCRPSRRWTARGSTRSGSTASGCRSRTELARRTVPGR